ncbi:MAG: hypothetical protein M4579_004159 [Chaenotheca gracillima]|nr:MAG: hypothetical protein M4579_004159 [Chaenotheca gracillima]
MDANEDGALRRSTSHNSAISSKSRNSDTVRVRPRKHPSSASSATTTTLSDDSLTSFPSLAPESPSNNQRTDTPKNAAQRSASPTPRKAPHTPAPTVASLTAATPTADRSALFDDSVPNSTHVPGTLHHTTDSHIQSMIARVGAVSLVRQLAEDVAQRDAQISAVRRRAEDRERVLRKMLLGCEVSQMDIEARLRSLDDDHQIHDQKKGGGNNTAKNDGGWRSSPRSARGSIDEMMNEAMSEAVGRELEGDFASLEASPTESDGPPGTIRAVSQTRSGRKISSDVTTGERPLGTTKGWRDYIWPTSGTSQRSSQASSVVDELNEEIETATRKRVSSANASRRKGLQSELFQPPESEQSHPSRRFSSQSNVGRTSNQDSIDTKSPLGKPANSVASWALKLVAGSSQTLKEDGKLARTRASSLASGAPHMSRTSSRASINTGSSAKAALSKTSAMTSNGPSQPRRTATPSGTGPNGTIKGTASNNSLALASSPQNADSTNQTNDSGPVEMDTILPPESQPPTLTQTYQSHHPSQFITDRFGFIYDQRRSKRQREAAEDVNNGPDAGTHREMLSPARPNFDLADAIDHSHAAETDNSSLRPSSISESRPETPASVQDSKPVKRWQDYLKTATFPTELLLHTPSASALAAVETGDADNGRKSKPITVGEGVSLPSASLNPEPEASTVVSDNATFAKPATTGSSAPVNPAKDQAEPVKLLLEQLTDLHDSIQREKTVKWNEFLRKVRAERQREGEVAMEGRVKKTYTPEVSLTDGEVVGVAGLGNKGKVGQAKWKEFKHLVLRGIPVAYRAKIWSECSGASALRVPGYYDDLVQNGVDDPVVVAQITMDINRTLTDNIFFRKGPGVIKLNEVLLAYSRRNPAVGYCQGMNLIAASLLLIMPTAEDAFWLLTSLIENILPADYYDHSLLASRADQQVLRQYVAEILPKLSGHLDDLGVELEALTFQWFLSVFTDCLSAEALFRVWDVVLCTHRDGSTFLFQVALALLKLNETQLLHCDSPAGVYSYINHNMTNHAISIDGLIQASDALKGVVQRKEVEARRVKAVRAEKETMRVRAEIARTKRGGAKFRKGGSSSANGSGAETSLTPAAAEVAVEERPEAQKAGGDIDDSVFGELSIQSPMPVEEN